MEHVNPWFVKSKCTECDEMHECGPFPSKDEAVEFGERMTEVDDRFLISELNAFQRDTPLTNDELANDIAQRCANEIGNISVTHRVAEALGNVPEGSVTGRVIAAVQAITVKTFNQYRPGSTVDDMVAALGGDAIGEVEGHA